MSTEGSIEHLSTDEQLAVIRLSKRRYAGKSRDLDTVARNSPDELDYQFAMLRLKRGLGYMSRPAYEKICHEVSWRGDGVKYSLRSIRVRTLRRRDHVDPLAEREPGEKYDDYLLAKFGLMIRQSRILREAKHGHTLDVYFGDGPSAKSDTYSVPPSAVGLPRSYARVAFRVTKSSHEITLTRGFRPFIQDGRIYIAENLRIRAGAGTSIAVEEMHINKRGGVSWKLRK